jgi:cysteine synthase
MNVRSGFLESIGRTPLIRLRAASDVTGCDIYGKAEFLNPGGSIKDRAALAIVDDAEQRGQLKPGGVIVEGTAGNVGIGIALVANARGYRSVIVMPDTQSQEKKDMLRLCGADLRLIPAVPYSNPGHYARYSGRLAEELGAFWANQFDNVANRDGHYRTTGPEIWEQTNGKVDGFTCAVGSGGTLGGVARALKERNPGVKIALSDPWAPPSTIGLLGACPNSRCSILGESDSTLGHEQVFSALEYRSDTAAAGECAGLRAERPCLAVYR